MILALLAGWFLWNKQKANQAEADAKAAMMHEVAMGDVIADVKVTATAKVSDEQSLSFGQEWKITNVYVKPWDRVKAWQVLAELDMESYRNSILSAELDLANARLGLSKMQNNDTTLPEAQLKSQLIDAQLWLQVEEQSTSVLNQQLSNMYLQKDNQISRQLSEYEIAKKSLDVLKSQQKNQLLQQASQLKQLRQDLDIAKQWLEVTADTAEIDVQAEQIKNSLVLQQQTIDNTLITLRSRSWEVEVSIQNIDAIFGATSTYTSPFWGNLSASDTWLRRKTQEYIRQAYVTLGKIRNNAFTLRETSDISAVQNALTSYINQSNDFIRMADSALQALDKSVPGTTITETDIIWARNTILWSRSNFAAFRSELQWQLTTLTNQLSSKTQNSQLDIANNQQQLNVNSQVSAIQKIEQNITILEEQIIALKKEQEVQIANQEATLLAQLDAINLATKELEWLKKENELQRSRNSTQITSQKERIGLLNKEIADVRKWANTYDVSQQQNIISLSSLALERAKDQQEKFQIKAEFDGRIRTVDMSIWEQYKLEDRKYIVVENPELIELELIVSQIDIVKIQENDPVLITFDAYPDTPIIEKISSRDLNPIPNARWWVSYKATILLQPQENLEIFAGMSALVTVTTDEAKDSVIIPTLALVSQNGKQYVYKKDGKEEDDYTLHEVTIWVNNNFQAQVIDGLQAWDIIKWSALSDEALLEMWIDDSSASIF